MAKKKTEPAEELAANQFELDGKKYNVLYGLIIPTKERGHLKMTAADICTDEEAQRLLVDGLSTAIREVTE